MPDPRASSHTITASEISQYAYCPLSWYLRRSGAPLASPGLERGIAEHERAEGGLRRAGRQERAAGLFRRIGYLLILAALLLLGWLLWT